MWNLYVREVFILGGYKGFHARARLLDAGGVGGLTQLSPRIRLFYKAFC